MPEIKEVITKHITFTEEELIRYNIAIWGAGFTACAEEHQKQREDPHYPIKRIVPDWIKRFWE